MLLKKKKLVEPSLRVGQRRERKSWKSLAALLSVTEDAYEALEILHDLLAIPRYAISKASAFDSVSGKPTEIKWVRDKEGMKCMFFAGNFTDFKLPECLVELFESHLEAFALGDRSATVYKTMESTDTVVGRTVIFSYANVSTGGGHNDSTTYANAVAVHIASVVFETLPGRSYK